MKKLLTVGACIFLTAGTLPLQAQTLEKMEKKFEAASNRNAAIETYLKDHKILNANISPDGIYYVTEKSTEGTKVNSGDFVSVHYTGKLFDGTKFDSSVDRGEPISFKIGIGQVIQGWEKGIPLFKVGEKGTIFLPANLAYGERGAGGVIPPNSPLIFDIEVVETTDEATYMENQKAIQLKLQAEEDAKRGQQSKIDKAIIEKYVADQNLKVTYLPSGLAYYMTEEGSGDLIQPGNTAVVHYTGKLLDDTKFDSSKDRNQPFPVQVGANRVIQGWEQGLQVFKAGGKGTLIIPSTLAYGDRGAGGIIQPNSVLLFDIEVLEIK
ncbi:MAG TPA: FKBP-type peptidyl-prolyl cis-trans isomerase [Chitinophagales bacterium]|nr:FKBP-type peptidyl-prolyl cis-trans isomerase [Chitinophagales bacterium]